MLISSKSKHSSSEIKTGLHNEVASVCCRYKRQRRRSNQQTSQQPSGPSPGRARAPPAPDTAAGPPSSPWCHHNGKLERVVVECSAKLPVRNDAYFVASLGFHHPGNKHRLEGSIPQRSRGRLGCQAQGDWYDCPMATRTPPLGWSLAPTGLFMPSQLAALWVASWHWQRGICTKKKVKCSFFLRS